MSRLLDAGEVEAAGTLLVDLFQFCHFQMVPEGNQWAKDLAWRMDEATPLAAAVNGAGALGAWFEADMDLARLGERSVEIAERIGIVAPSGPGWRWSTRLATWVGWTMWAALPRPHHGLPGQPRQVLARQRPGCEVIGRVVGGDVAQALVRSEDALQLAGSSRTPTACIGPCTARAGP